MQRSLSPLRVVMKNVFKYLLLPALIIAGLFTIVLLINQYVENENTTCTDPQAACYTTSINN